MRYTVHFPVDLPGAGTADSSDDLEEAGQILLNTKGASDIYDNVEHYYIDPIMEIDCCAKAYLSWSRRQRRRRLIGWAIPKRLKRRWGW